MMIDMCTAEVCCLWVLSSYLCRFWSGRRGECSGDRVWIVNISWSPDVQHSGL